MCGGERAVEGSLRDGCFVKPTVFANARPEMRIVQEEIFGPVVAVLPCADYEEGIRLLNQSRYGLSSSIYTQNVNFAARAERDIECGLVYINASTIGAEIQLPFGGYIQVPGTPKLAGAWGLSTSSPGSRSSIVTSAVVCKKPRSTRSRNDCRWCRSAPPE
ncbi:MAG: aldehyde dehydrogenase family protein [Syntrophotaleaceae bacterium]